MSRVLFSTRDFLGITASVRRVCRDSNGLQGPAPWIGRYMEFNTAFLGHPIGRPPLSGLKKCNSQIILRFGRMFYVLYTMHIKTESVEV